MGMDACTLTRNVKLLITHGWVSQSPGADSRSRSLAITAAGRAKPAEARSYWKRAPLTLNERLGNTEIGALHELIDGAIA